MPPKTSSRGTQAAGARTTPSSKKRKHGQSLEETLSASRPSRRTGQSQRHKHPAEFFAKFTRERNPYEVEHVKMMVSLVFRRFRNRDDDSLNQLPDEYVKVLVSADPSAWKNVGGKEGSEHEHGDSETSELDEASDATSHQTSTTTTVRRKRPKTVQEDPQSTTERRKAKESKAARSRQKVQKLRNEPLMVVAESVLHAAMVERKWDCWSAYAELKENGAEGVYRNARYPSWDPAQYKESVDCSSQIQVPDDVVYLACLGTFGTWAMNEDEVQLRTAIDAPRDSQETLSTEDDDEESVEARVKRLLQENRSKLAETTKRTRRKSRRADPDIGRDVTQTPHDMLAAINEDCYTYIRAIASRYLERRLIQRVKKAKRVLRDQSTALESLLLDVGRADNSSMEWRKTLDVVLAGNPIGDHVGQSSENEDETEARRMIAGNTETMLDGLDGLHTTIRRISRAHAIVNPHLPINDEAAEGANRLYDWAARLEHKLRLNTQTTPEELRGLQRLRRRSAKTLALVNAEGEGGDEDGDDDGTDVLHPEEVDGLSCLHTLAPTPPDAAAAREPPLGFRLFHVMDDIHARALAGLPRGSSWPRVSDQDNLLSTTDKPVKLALRPHCTLGAVEIVSRSFESKSRDRDDPEISPHDWGRNRGCIVADATGLGKTGQAIQVLGLISHLAHTFAPVGIPTAADPVRQYDLRDAFMKDIAKDLPAIMLRDRGPLVIALTQAKQAAKQANIDFDPQPIIDRILASARGNLLEFVVPAVLMPLWLEEIDRFSDGTLFVTPIYSAASAHGMLAHIEHLQTAWDSAIEQADAATFDRQRYRRESAIPSDQIVLASLPTLSRCHTRLQGRQSRGETTERSIFNMRFATMVLDEAHFVKSRGKVQTAVHYAATRCAFTIAQTATPVQNSAQDMCFIGNAIDLPEARHVANGTREQAPVHFVNVRRLEGRQHAKDQRAMLARMGQFYQHLPADPDQGATRAYASDPPNKSSELHAVGEAIGADISIQQEYQTATEQCLAVYRPYMIRRDKMSTDRQGQPILRLGSLDQMMVNVKLTDAELGAMQRYLGEMKDERVQRWGEKRAYEAMLGFFGPTYAQAKAATVHPGWFAGGNILYDGPPSSKIRAALDIIAIHQEREAAIPGLADKDRAKFILHIDSVQAMAPVIWEVYRRGWSCRTFTGMSTVEERQRLLDDVNADEDHPADHGHLRNRILVCSSVGSVGLSFARLNVVINLTFPWSSALYWQRVGRSWRVAPDPSVAPRKVYVYNILGINSVDLVTYVAYILKSRLEDPLSDIAIIRGRLMRELVGPAGTEPRAPRQKIKPVLPPSLRRRVPNHLVAVDYTSKSSALVNAAQRKQIERLGLDHTFRYLRGYKHSLDTLLPSAVRLSTSGAVDSNPQQAGGSSRSAQPSQRTPSFASVITRSKSHAHVESNKRKKRAHEMRDLNMMNNMDRDEAESLDANTLKQLLKDVATDGQDSYHALEEEEDPDAVRDVHVTRWPPIVTESTLDQCRRLTAAGFDDLLASEWQGARDRKLKEIATRLWQALYDTRVGTGDGRYDERRLVRLLAPIVNEHRSLVVAGLLDNTFALPDLPLDCEEPDDDDIASVNDFVALVQEHLAIDRMPPVPVGENESPSQPISEIDRLMLRKPSQDGLYTSSDGHQASRAGRKGKGRATTPQQTTSDSSPVRNPPSSPERPDWITESMARLISGRDEQDGDPGPSTMGNEL